MSPPRPSHFQRAGEFVGVDRKKGQAVAMNKTNARAYAVLTDTDGAETTDWEWLHIRAASLGGDTQPFNLVLGTRDANTQMMPFESSLRTLGTKAKTQKQELMVDWTPGAPKNGNVHVVDEIKIAWQFPADRPKIEGSVTVNPLNTSSVLTKNEVRFLQTQLKEHRDRFDQNDQVESSQQPTPVGSFLSQPSTPSPVKSSDLLNITDSPANTSPSMNKSVQSLVYDRSQDTHWSANLFSPLSNVPSSPNFRIAGVR